MDRTHVLLVLWVFTLFENGSYGQIPMSMWRKMANITSTSQFLEEFIAPQERQGAIEQYGSMSPSHRGSIANLVSGEAGCIPQEDTVSIPSDADVNIVRWPTCTRVNRCGGCCGHESLQCAPTHVQMQPVQVLRARYPFPGAERLVVEGIEEVLMERHLACECRCRVQPHHCDSVRQRYDADACSCRCVDQNQWRTCTAEQRWEEATCSCVCRDTYLCFSNEIYNNTTCRCENRQTGSGSGPGSRSVNEIMRTTPSAPPVSTSSPCPNLRCLSGFQAQVMLGTCRCMLIHRYTSSQTAVEDDRLFRVEATEYDSFPKPRSDDIFAKYTPSSKQEVPRIFQRFPLRQQMQSEGQDEIFKNEITKEEKSTAVTVEKSPEDIIQQADSVSSAKETKTSQGHQGSSPTHSERRHHVDITVTNDKPKRYTGAHHAVGGPLEMRQPMVQANYGHV